MAVLAVLCACEVAGAQQLVDRVVARVNGDLVLLSDVQAAVAVGMVSGKTEAEQVQQMVQRHLLLDEASRFPPPEPSPEDVAGEVARMKGRVGQPDQFLAAHGLDEGQLVTWARDTLRVQAYLAQRFGFTAPVPDDLVLEYYRAHPEEFTIGGVRQPFEEVREGARTRAAAARRSEAVEQWLRDLEARADVVRPQRP